MNNIYYNVEHDYYVMKQFVESVIHAEMYFLDLRKFHNDFSTVSCHD